MIAVNLLSCLGQLIVAALVFLGQRREKGRNAVALSLGILALDVFAWNFFEFAYATSGELAWHYLDLSFSPFSPILVFILVAAFTGQRRRMRPLIVAGLAVFSGLSLLAITALFFVEARPLVESWVWSATFVFAESLLGVVALVLSIRHYVRSDGGERRRAGLVLLALVIGVAFTTTDLWNDMGYGVPALGSLGTLIGMALMAVATLRFSFLGHTPGARRACTAVVIAIASVATYLLALRWLSTHRAQWAIATVTLGVIIVAAARELMVRWVRRNTRMQSLANLGKLAAQMAHDIQNPLAAVKGAVQYLRGEVARGRSLEEQERFLGLLEQQIDRMGRVISNYRRLGRAEPEWHQIDINETVRSVLGLQSFASQKLQIRTELADHLPHCNGDPDLLSVALENVVRNAAESMKDGGVVTVRTSMVKRMGFKRTLELSVEDSGSGIDAQHLDRAFDLFYTTKPTGSGLGLAYVRRVVVAHNGRVRLTSRVGVGTTVKIELPVN